MEKEQEFYELSNSVQNFLDSEESRKKKNLEAVYVLYHNPGIDANELARLAGWTKRYRKKATTNASSTLNHLWQIGLVGRRRGMNVAENNVFNFYIKEKWDGCCTRFILSNKQSKNILVNRIQDYLDDKIPTQDLAEAVKSVMNVRPGLKTYETAAKILYKATGVHLELDPNWTFFDTNGKRKI